MQRLTRDLAGYNLNAATGFLATLSAFEQETLEADLLRIIPELTSGFHPYLLTKDS